MLASKLILVCNGRQYVIIIRGRCEHSSEKLRHYGSLKMVQITNH